MRHRLDFPLREAHVASLCDHLPSGAFVDGKELALAATSFDHGVLGRKHSYKGLIFFRTHCARVGRVDPKYCSWIVHVARDIDHNLGMIRTKMYRQPATWIFE
jgi:hypothetical protein